MNESRRSLFMGAPNTMGAPGPDSGENAFFDTLDWHGDLGAQLAQLPGPFVFATTDPRTSDVVLARDRLGRNRLFYHIGPQGVRWSVDLVGLAREVGPEGVSAEGLRELLAYRWNMGQETSLHGIRQVQPGTIVRIDPSGVETLEHFWTLPLSPVAEFHSLEPWIDEAQEAMEAGLARILESSEKPFVLLSGGVDSAIEAAIAHRIRPDLVAVTPEWALSTSPELPRAKAVAEQLGIEHRVLLLQPEDIRRMVPWAIARFGGPIRDYHMVMLAWVYEQLAPEGFDLVLHGQAADTFFGAGNIGHVAKFGAKRKWLDPIPSSLLRGIAGLLPETTGLGERMAALLAMDRETALRRRHRLLHRKALRRQAPLWLAERNPSKGAMERVPSRASEPVRIQISDYYQGTISHMVTSTAISFPHGIAMGYPFLTPEMLEVARRLPDAAKWRGEETKPVLKDLGARFFPREWMQAPKLGFPTPTISWLEGPLAPWVRERLGKGSFSRAFLGDDLISGLTLPVDFELIWTLANLEEFLALVFPGVDRGDIPILDP